MADGVSGGAAGSLRDRQKEAVRRELRAVALMLFKERGFAATTVDDIAREAGVSRSTFFRYFGSKTAVVVDATDESGVVFMRCLSERPRAEKPMQSLENALIAMTEAMRTDERRAEMLLMREVSNNEPALVAAIESRFAHFQTEVARCLAQREGRREPSLEDALASAILAPITAHIGEAWAAGDDRDGVAELIRSHFETVRRLTAG
jgi:AcrR family transcriptional regulator